MKRFLVILMMLVCINSPILAKDRHHSSSSSCDHKHKHKKHKKKCKKQCAKQHCAATSITQAQTITQSGVYCLENDIIGTIVIAASNVILDLNSHTVNGGGAAAAITADGRTDVTIKNGLVINPGSLAINVSNSIGALVENVQVSGSDRALVLSGCSTSQVNSFKAYNNINTFVDPTTGAGGAVILVDSSDSIELNDVEANNNFKALSASVGTTNPGIGILTVFNSSNVKLTNCSTNFNTRADNNSRFAPFVGLFSSNVTATNCQSNNNTISVDDVRGFAPLHFRACLDVVIDGCQANGNNVGTFFNLYRPIYVIATPRVVIKNSQANDNSAQLIGNAPGNAVDLTGLMCFATAGPQSDIVISHCQVSGNFAADSEPNRIIESQVNGIFINGFSDAAGFENRCLVEYCQVNDNANLSGNPLNVVLGIVVEGNADATVANCSADGNRGGDRVIGIALIGEPDSATGFLRPALNNRILNSTANNTQSAGSAIGIFVGGFFNRNVGATGNAQNCEVVGCQANRNGLGDANLPPAVEGYGIVLSNAIGCSVIECQTNQNLLTGIKAGTGLNLDPATNIDCSIINCSAKENGLNGFEIDDSLINDNFLIQDNVALANNKVGFLHSQATLTSRYLGNYAKGNGTDFQINNGAIQLYGLDSLGFYTLITVDPVHFSELINIEESIPQ